MLPADSMGSRISRAERHWKHAQQVDPQAVVKQPQVQLQLCEGTSAAPMFREWVGDAQRAHQGGPVAAARDGAAPLLALPAVQRPESLSVRHSCTPYIRPPSSRVC